MPRPLNQHLERWEVDALVAAAGREESLPGPLSQFELGPIHDHLKGCAGCAALLAQYLAAEQTLKSLRVKPLGKAPTGCPKDVNWVDLAAGLLPKRRTQELIRHAADCGFCGAELGDAAGILSEETTREEDELIAALPIPPLPLPAPNWFDKFVEQFRAAVRSPLYQAAAAALLLAISWSYVSGSDKPLATASFLQVAVKLHRDRVEGSLPLDLKADRLHSVTDWLADNFSFDKKLPSLPPASDAGSPADYQVEGANKVKVGSAYAALVSYRLPLELTSLLIVRESKVKAQGGVEVSYTQDLTFHYQVVEGYKVVTWSVHGITYALVSGPRSTTQKACMVCHAGMNDRRDFSKTPYPPMAGFDKHP